MSVSAGHFFRTFSKRAWEREVSSKYYTWALIIWHLYQSSGIDTSNRRGRSCWSHKRRFKYNPLPLLRTRVWRQWPWCTRILETSHFTTDSDTLNPPNGPILAAFEARLEAFCTGHLGLITLNMPVSTLPAWFGKQGLHGDVSSGSEFDHRWWR